MSQQLSMSQHKMVIFFYIRFYGTGAAVFDDIYIPFPKILKTNIEHSMPRIYLRYRGVKNEAMRYEILGIFRCQGFLDYSRFLDFFFREEIRGKIPKSQANVRPYVSLGFCQDGDNVNRYDRGGVIRHVLSVKISDPLFPMISCRKRKKRFS